MKKLFLFTAMTLNTVLSIVSFPFLLLINKSEAYGISSKAKFEKLNIEKNFILSEIYDCKEAIEAGNDAILRISKDPNASADFIEDIRISIKFQEANLNLYKEKLALVENKIFKLRV